MPENSYLMAATVFVLGAGFSKAISPAMPLMADLGGAVAEALKDRQMPAARPSAGDDVEVWLSYALEDQPFLSSEQNLLNRAAAQAAIDALRNFVVQRQGEAEHDGIPEWLDNLVTIWHGLRSDVVTLNWDTVIEDVTDSLGLWSLGYPTSPSDVTPISSDDVFGRVPRLAPGSAAGGPPGRTTFRLWKLHGSVDWFWSEGDPHGETVVRRPHNRPVVGDTAGIAGKTPFFAAPTASKVLHYGNQIIRHIWRGARSALESADEVVVIGYSLPLTDLTVRALLAGTAASRITLVDPAAREVHSRVLGVLGDAVNVIEHSGVEEFVDVWATSFMQAHSSSIIQDWDGDPATPALAALSNARYGVVTAVERTKRGVELVSSEWWDSLNQATSINAQVGLDAAAIKRACLGDCPVFVDGPDARPRLIYDATLLRRETGRSNTWMQLRCQA